MTERLGDAPIDPKLVKLLNSLAHGIDEILNGKELKENGFVLMVFPFDGHEGRCNYISNARRADIVIMLKEQIKRFEAVTGPPDDYPGQLKRAAVELFSDDESAALEPKP